MVILKDRADALLALSIFLIPKIIVPEYEKVPFYDEFRTSVLAIFLILNFSNAFTYNQKHLLKTLVSFVSRIALSFLLTEVLVKIAYIQINSYLKIALLTSIFILYLFLVRFLRWGNEKLQGDYRLAFSYLIGEIVFFYGCIIYSLFILFKGYGFWLAIKVFALGYGAKIFFRVLTSISAKSHIRELIKRFGDRWWRYKVTVFNSKEPNAFAYWSGSKNAIGVTTALAQRFTADEINFTVAHEYAHHLKNHLTVKLKTELIHRGGFWILHTLNLLSPFTLAVGGIFHLFKKALYKSDEYEADRVAVEFLHRAGLTQRGAITLFEKFLKLEPKMHWFVRKLGNLFFENHPYTEKRLEKIRKLIKF